MRGMRAGEQEREREHARQHILIEPHPRADAQSRGASSHEPMAADRPACTCAMRIVEPIWVYIVLTRAGRKEYQYLESPLIVK